MNIIRLLYHHAGKALVATALPISAGQKQFDMNYIDPHMLLEFARQKVTPSAELLWNEGMDDFMLVLDKAMSARTA